MEYKKYLPSGNTTILVEDYIENEELRKQINNELMTKYPDVEQVGFLDKENKKLIMAGGEFCANATRCAVFNLLNGKPGNTIIEINNNKLNAGIAKNYNVWTEVSHLYW